MPAWFYVLAAAAVLFVAWFGFARRWWHALRYSMRRARHLADVTQTELIPGAEYWGAPLRGSMMLEEEISYWNDPPAYGAAMLSNLPAPTWREQTAAELSPEALAAVDSGPGWMVSSPGPDPMWADRNAGRFDSAPGGPGSDHALSGAPGSPALAPSRLADTGDVAAAHEAHPSPDWLDGQLADLFAWVREVHASLAAS